MTVCLPHFGMLISNRIKTALVSLSVHISHLGLYLSQEAFQYVDITYLISLQGVLCELKAIKFGIGNQEILIVITIQP